MRSLPFLALALVLVAVPAAAQDGTWPLAISVHVTPSVPPPFCDNAPAFTLPEVDPEVGNIDCAAGLAYDVWVFACHMSDENGVAGMEFGVDYDAAAGSGVDVDAFTVCGDLQFAEPGWPAPGTGTIVTWDAENNCQDTLSEPFVPYTVIAIAGVFHVTVHSPDQLRITPRPASGVGAVADCSARRYVVDPSYPYPLFGWAGFCEFGWNSCIQPDPVEPTTWGRVKSQFASGRRSSSSGS